MSVATTDVGLARQLPKEILDSIFETLVEWEPCEYQWTLTADTRKALAMLVGLGFGEITSAEVAYFAHRACQVCVSWRRAALSKLLSHCVSLRRRSALKIALHQIDETTGVGEPIGCHIDSLFIVAADPGYNNDIMRPSQVHNLLRRGVKAKSLSMSLTSLDREVSAFAAQQNQLELLHIISLRAYQLLDPSPLLIDALPILPKLQVISLVSATLQISALFDGSCTFGLRLVALEFCDISGADLCSLLLAAASTNVALSRRHHLADALAFGRLTGLALHCVRTDSYQRVLEAVAVVAPSLHHLCIAVERTIDSQRSADLVGGRRLGMGDPIAMQGWLINNILPLCQRLRTLCINDRRLNFALVWPLRHLVHFDVVGSLDLEPTVFSEVLIDHSKLPALKCLRLRRATAFSTSTQRAAFSARGIDLQFEHSDHVSTYVQKMVRNA